MQIEMIVRRQSENRDRVTYPGAFEPLATIRARCSNKDCADIFDGSGSLRQSTTTRCPCSAQSSWAVLSAIAPPPTTIMTGSPGSATADSLTPPRCRDRVGIGAERPHHLL